MKFLIGEGGWSWLERAMYRGGIGLFYDSTWGGVLAYAIFAIVCILAVIGLITVISFLFSGTGGKGKKKMSSHEKWIKTGKF